MIAIDPNQRLRLAQQKQAAGDLSAALQIYQELLQLFPEHTGLMNACGQLEMQLGHHTLAIQRFLHSLEIQPDQVSVWCVCGQLWQSMQNYEQAVRCFTQALDQDKACVPAVMARAQSYLMLGELNFALRDCTLAVHLKPNAETFYNRGTIYLRLERAKAALADFDRALQLKPGHVNALINRGITKLGLQQAGAALADFDRAIAEAPQTTAAHRERAMALRQLKRPEAALEACDHALALCKTDSDIWNCRGQILLDLGQPEAAVTAFTRASEQTNDARYHNNLAIALRLCGRYPEALSAVTRALALNSRDHRAHLNHGQILVAQGQLTAALAALGRATEIEPYNGEAWAERGRVLLHLDRLSDAAGSFGRALAIDPADGQSWCNHGTCWVRENRAAEARYDFDMARSCAPDNPDILWNAALCDLTLGHYETGWPLYEARLRRSPIDASVRRFTRPRWTGTTDISGKKLLLYAEQGAGDVIQFCRYIPALQQAGAAVSLMAHAPLLPLLHSLSDVNLLPLDAPLPEHDLQCPLMSLPLAFLHAGWTTPEAKPYLFAAPGRSQMWLDKLAHTRRSGRPQIGLVVSGAPDHANDAKRSVPLADMAALLLVNADFWLLQPKVRTTDLEVARTYLNLHLPKAALTDYGETAGLISGLSLVISVDTSVAHLAGAMGKPVWLMLPWCAEWRWGEHGEETAWYPSMRLFRQARPGDWPHLSKELAELLKKNIFPSQALC